MSYSQIEETKNKRTRYNKKWNTHEVDKVYEGLNKFLADNFDGLHIPFPSQDGKDRLLIESIKMAKDLDYPEMTDEPTI